jgi:hypothetical protein
LQEAFFLANTPAIAFFQTDLHRPPKATEESALANFAGFADHRRHGAIHVRILQHRLTAAAATSGQWTVPLIFFEKNWVIRLRISHCIPRRFSVPVARSALARSSTQSDWPPCKGSIFFLAKTRTGIRHYTCKL